MPKYVKCEHTVETEIPAESVELESHGYRIVVDPEPAKEEPAPTASEEPSPKQTSRNR